MLPRRYGRPWLTDGDGLLQVLRGSVERSPRGGDHQDRDQDERPNRSPSDGTHVARINEHFRTCCRLIRTSPSSRLLLISVFVPAAEKVYLDCGTLARRDCKPFFFFSSGPVSGRKFNTRSDFNFWKFTRIRGALLDPDSASRFLILKFKNSGNCDLLCGKT